MEIATRADEADEVAEWRFQGFSPLRRRGCTVRPDVVVEDPAAVVIAGPRIVVDARAY